MSRSWPAQGRSKSTSFKSYNLLMSAVQREWFWRIASGLYQLLQRVKLWTELTKSHLFYIGPIHTRSWFVFVSWIGRPFQVVFVSQGWNLIFTIASTHISVCYFSCVFDWSCLCRYLVQQITSPPTLPKTYVSGVVTFSCFTFFSYIITDTAAKE